jgi:hypothetical protein
MNTQPHKEEKNNTTHQNTKTPDCTARKNIIKK